MNNYSLRYKKKHENKNLCLSHILSKPQTLDQAILKEDLKHLKAIEDKSDEVLGFISDIEDKLKEHEEYERFIQIQEM